MAVPVLIPSPHKVAIEWLRSLTALSNFIDPADISFKHKAAAQWAKPYAIVCSTVATGANAFAPLRSPVVQVDVYGRHIAGRLPWETCAALAELIADQTYEPANPGAITVDNDAVSVRVGDVSLSRSPQILSESDTATLARASLDVRIMYTPIYE
jgi:hypothetical protein